MNSNIIIFFAQFNFGQFKSKDLKTRDTYTVGRDN